MNWLSRNAQSIEAVAAAITAIAAVAALIGIQVQLDGADRVQRMQSAREAYRSHLALAAASPLFAQPKDACELIASDQGGAYAAFVDHLLYSAEQMLAVSEGWDRTFLGELDNHRDYLCSQGAPQGETVDTERLLAQFRKTACDAAPSCR